MFVVPKKGGKWRPIINLKFLNQFVEKPHFEMEDIRSLKDILQEEEQMAKLDLKDAYFSVSIAEKHRKFLQFSWRNQLFKFTCLPFGLSSIPYVFTKLLRPILTFLRDKGVCCLMYLDDMLILGRTAEELNHNFTLVKSLLTLLEFLVNGGQISSGSNTGVRVPGIYNQFQGNDSSSNGRESEIFDLTVQNLDGITSDHNSTTCSNYRCHDINDPNCTSSTSPLPGPSRAKKYSLGPPPLIVCTDYPDSGSETGLDLVEDTSEMVEILKYSTEESSANTGVRCFRPGLRSSMSQPDNIDSRCMEYTRDDLSHQLQGTFCSMVGASMLCFEPTGCTHTSSDRQHSSSGLCEQNGRSAFQGPMSTSTADLGLVSVQEPYNFSRAPTRVTEPTGRQGIENRLEFIRMGTTHTDLSQADGDEGSMFSGSLCIPPFSQTSNIFQFEIGSRSKSSGYTNTVVEQHQRLCLPSILPNRQMSDQNQVRESSLGTVDHTLMESQTLFPLLPEMSVEPPILLPSNGNLLTNSRENPHFIQALHMN